jgi:hypothetical protein
VEKNLLGVLCTPVCAWQKRGQFILIQQCKMNAQQASAQEVGAKRRGLAFPKLDGSRSRSRGGAGYNAYESRHRFHVNVNNKDFIRQSQGNSWWDLLFPEPKEHLVDITLGSGAMRQRHHISLSGTSSNQI